MRHTNANETIFCKCNKKGEIQLPQKLYKDIKQSKKQLQEYFGNSVDFYTKDIKLCGVMCCVCIFEGLSSLERLWIVMLDSLTSKSDFPKECANLHDYLMEKTEIPFEKTSVDSLENAVMRLTSGASVVLIDGSENAVGMATQNWEFRSVQEPGTEGNLRGSKEGFTEPLRINITLVRRLIRTGDLRIETHQLGNETMTEVALFYNNKLVPKDVLNTLKDKLKNSNLPFAFDTGYLAGFMREGSFSVFQSVGYTERPDTAAAKICEGKIVVMINGSPFAMIVPYFFNENFQSMDDYTEKAYFATFVRLLKYLSFFIAVMLPGIFVCITDFTPEILPEQLLYRVMAAEQTTPLPIFLETLFMIFLLEVVREAGLRMPKPIGQSVNLVAALIVGDAAISVGLVSAPVVIVTALTAICGYVVPSLYEPITSLRILFILAGGLLGPFGILVIFILMILSTSNMEIMGLAYTAPFAPGTKTALTDGFIRVSWKKLIKTNNSVWKSNTAEDINEDRKP